MSSTSGIPGITWEAQRRKWKLRIGGKYIGLYDTVMGRNEYERTFTESTDVARQHEQ